MTRQSTQPLTHHSLSATNRQAREVANNYKSGWLLLDAPYQRGSVWTLDQRIALVQSWLLGIPVPAIMTNDRMTRRWRETNGREPAVNEPFIAVIDGKQRCETAIMWFDGDLAVPASWFLPSEVVTTIDTDDGPYVTNDGLSVAEQRRVNNRAMLPVIEANVDSITAEADLYLLVNGGGTPQTAADLDNAALYSSKDI